MTLRIASVLRQSIPGVPSRNTLSVAAASTMASTATLDESRLKTVLVAGGSYAGHEAVNVLSKLLPPTYRVVLLERNSHFHHVYAFPRYSVLPGHEHKAFIPYTNVFGVHSGKNDIDARHRYIQGTLDSINVNDNGQGSATYRSASHEEQQEQKLRFDYLVYALGSQRPGSIDLWASSAFKGTKLQGISGLQKAQEAIKQANEIVIVGAGPLGVEFAGDIADVYSDEGKKPLSKRVTLISSRTGVLPRLNEQAQQSTLEWLKKRGVNVVLGERLQDEPKEGDDAHLHVETNKGNVFTADIVLDCRGLTPYTTPLRPLLDDTSAEWSGTLPAKQNRYLQLVSSVDAKSKTFSQVYVAGDAGEAFGAHKDGKNAREQAGLASRNIVRQIALSSSTQEIDEQTVKWAKSFLQEYGDKMEEYWPVALRIKVSLGLSDTISQSQGQAHFRKGGGEPDLNVKKHWINRGLSTDDMYL